MPHMKEIKKTLPFTIASKERRKGRKEGMDE
jgi:hypothetical protein